MDGSIIILLCILILISYTFDLSSKHTRIPSVILLLVLGWLVHVSINLLNFEAPPLKPFLPALGTIGLILIVLEGSLELEINKGKRKILTASISSAAISFVILAVIFAFGFSYVSNVGFYNGLVNAIPLCIISSAIAIPSVNNMSQETREYITYESSLSDIIGVIVFNFIIRNEVLVFVSVVHFVVQLIIIILISFVASFGLAVLIKKIDHHVKFLPIIVTVILIYFISKEFHLPGLIFILMFGLFLNNLDELKRVPYIKNITPQFEKEVVRFREIVVELSFLVRTIFFLLFGFLIDVEAMLNGRTILYALIIASMILLVRFVYFRITGTKLIPLLFIAPRGLITVLLFLSLPVSNQIPFVSESLVIMVIVMTSLLMFAGLILSKRNNTEAGESQKVRF